MLVFARIVHEQGALPHWLTAPTEEQAEAEVKAWCERKLAMHAERSTLRQSRFETSIFTAKELRARPVAERATLPGRLHARLKRCAD